MNNAFLQVKVFNEKFIDEKLRVDGDGIGSIVMLGDAGNIKDEINKKEAERNRVREEREVLEAKSERSGQLDDELCPEYWREKLADMLKGDAHWASRKKQIEGGQRNARVDDSVLTRIIGLPKPDSDLSTLAPKFQTELVEYRSLASGNIEKLPECPSIPS